MARVNRRKDDGNISTIATSASALSLTADTWYTAKVVVDDDPQNAALQRLRFWVDTDNDGDWSDETTLITSTAVDDDWSAGYVGLYKGAGDSTVHQFDDVKLGFDTERDQAGSVKGDGDILDAGDDVLVDDNFNSNQISLSYDNKGNLTADGVYNYVYDAWNRLRKAQLVVGSDTTTIGEYEYYGDNRRSKKTVANHGPEVVANDGGNTTVMFYYDRQWRIVETRNGSNQTTFQYLWGTQYTDELIWLEKNGDPTESNDTNPDDQSGESTADERYFVHQDRNWNVVALSEYDTGGTNNGRIAERYSYAPYGQFVVLKGDSGSGEFDSVSLTSTVGNPFAHQGLLLDHEKGSYQNRWRECAARRFVQRDPSGYRDGLNLYAHLAANPLVHADPSGLLNRCEWCWCLKNPFCCVLSAGTESEIAQFVSGNFGGAVVSDQGVYNAILHCTWMCTIAAIPGCSCEEAHDLGVAHECGDTSSDAQNDLHNNTHGLWCAWCDEGCSGEEGGGNSDMDTNSCVDCCERSAQLCQLGWNNTSCANQPPGRARDLCEQINSQCNPEGGRRESYLP